MKAFCLFLAISLFSLTAPAASLPFDTVAEKRYVTLLQTDNTLPYLLNTTNGNLWQLDPIAKEWIFLGSPRGASTHRKGGYQLLPHKPGEILILNNDSGDTWWTDGTTWLIIKKPSARKTQSPADS